MFDWYVDHEPQYKNYQRVKSIINKPDWTVEDDCLAIEDTKKERKKEQEDAEVIM